MKTLLLATLFLSLAAAGSSVVQLTPAQRRIDQALKEIEKTPDRVEPRNNLAAALLRRARETGDIAFLSQAQVEVNRSLMLQKDNYMARKVEAGILLASHEYTRAREAATALNKRNMDDIEVYGLLADASGETGDYKAAEEAAQWMLDLRPSDYRSLEHGAHFREIFGNPAGAADLWVSALRQVPEQEFEERAWILVSQAALYLKMDNVAAAERAATDALKIFPAHPLAAVALAHVRMVQEKYAEAAILLQSVPHLPLAEHYTLAQALEKAGNPEATTAYTTFNSKARAALEKPDNANRELVFYLAGRANQPAEALKIARGNADKRQDILTLDALAWAFHVNHEDKAAREIMRKILTVSTKDPAILAHAKALDPETK